MTASVTQFDPNRVCSWPRCWSRSSSRSDQAHADDPTAGGNPGARSGHAAADRRHRGVVTPRTPRPRTRSRSRTRPAPAPDPHRRPVPAARSTSRVSPTVPAAPPTARRRDRDPRRRRPLARGHRDEHVAGPDVTTGGTADRRTPAATPAIARGAGRRSGVASGRHALRHPDRNRERSRLGRPERHLPGGQRDRHRERPGRGRAGRDHREHRHRDRRLGRQHRRRRERDATAPVSSVAMIVGQARRPAPGPGPTPAHDQHRDTRTRPATPAPRR